MSVIEVKVPDIGDFKDVPVIEIFVKPGDAVKAEDSLITLESEKATMDVPAPAAGTVKELKLKLGDKVAEGVPILTLESADGPAKEPSPAPSPQPSSASEGSETTAAHSPSPSPSPQPSPARGRGSESESPVPQRADSPPLPRAGESGGEGASKDAKSAP